MRSILKVFYLEWLANIIDACGVDSFSPSSWKPQEEGMMNIAARFSLRKKPRFIDQERNRQTTEGDAC
jgi:hypothetical protein